MFRQISLSLDILIDTAKRNYLDTRLESDRRKKAQYAEMNKKRKAMVDVGSLPTLFGEVVPSSVVLTGLQALNIREEEAKKAKVEQVRRRQHEAEEEVIKDAGRKMLEEAQKRAMAAQSNQTPVANGNGLHKPPSNGHTPASRQNGPSTDKQPPITSLDLTLELRFPSSSIVSSSSSTLQSTLQNRYGPINHVVLRDPPPPEPGKKKKKIRKAIVEFGTGNWGGCWACWRDHDEGAREGAGVGEGVRAKWAAGRVPNWVDWAARQGNGIDRQPPPNGTNGSEQPSAPSFGSAPDFGGTSMADLLARHSLEKETKSATKKKEDEFESMTLLRMRQMERDRLTEQIRREEEEEAMA